LAKKRKKARKTPERLIFLKKVEENKFLAAKRARKNERRRARNKKTLRRSLGGKNRANVGTRRN